ncbi:unnamed protein product [Linum tenue]|uniref:Uncharacterized protein n=1 Tax=Linum tenue TaxID=586396 RepID=A0AAV0GPH5_9ROSI|nr:unnamed protein product [Linum tenue]
MGAEDGRHPVYRHQSTPSPPPPGAGVTWVGHNDAQVNRLPTVRRKAELKSDYSPPGSVPKDWVVRSQSSRAVVDGQGILHFFLNFEVKCCNFHKGDKFATESGGCYEIVASVQSLDKLCNEYMYWSMIDLGLEDKLLGFRDADLVSFVRSGG